MLICRIPMTPRPRVLGVLDFAAAAALAMAAIAPLPALAQPGSVLPAELLTPSRSWRSGAMSPSVFYDKATGLARAPTGTARVLHFEKDGPGTVVEETFAQASSMDGQARSSLTTVHYAVTVGSVVDDEGVRAPTLSFRPTKGNYRVVNNGAVSTRAIDDAELKSGKFSGRTYAVVRQTDPNYGKPQEVLVMVDLGDNKKVDDTDVALKYIPYTP